MRRYKSKAFPIALKYFGSLKRMEKALGCHYQSLIRARKTHLGMEMCLRIEKATSGRLSALSLYETDTKLTGVRRTNPEQQ